MADWTTPLPGTAVEGEDTHVEDHNAIVAAIAEAREFLDQLETAVSGHQHSADDITSGTLAAARIPTLSFGKVSGLQSALDGKAETTVTDDHESRIAALEAEPEV